jgi:hypothetical protein
MAQDLARATVFSQSLGNWLQRAETETPGSQLSIPPSVRAEAERALQAVEDALQPAPQATVERWLGALGTLVAGQLSAEDARTRSLDAAARSCKWFPSYAEVCQLLDAEVAAAHRQRHLLRRAIAAPVEGDKPVGRYSAMTDAQKAEFDTAMAKFRSRFASDASRSAEDGSGTPEAR